MDSNSNIFDVAKPEVTEALLREFQSSTAARNFSRSPKFSPEAAQVALEKLYQILIEKGVKCRKWRRDNMYRCYLSYYKKPNIKYIEINPFNGECGLVERSNMEMYPSEVPKVEAAIEEWRDWSHRSQRLWNAQADTAYEAAFLEWLAENDYTLVGGSARDVLGAAEEENDQEQYFSLKGAEFEYAILKIDAEIRQAESEGDDEGIRDLERLRSALTEERKQLLAAEDAEDIVTTPLLDEVTEMLDPLPEGEDLRSAIDSEPEFEYDGEDEEDLRSAIESEPEFEYDGEDEEDLQDSTPLGPLFDGYGEDEVTELDPEEVPDDAFDGVSPEPLDLEVEEDLRTPEQTDEDDDSLDPSMLPDDIFDETPLEAPDLEIEGDHSTPEHIEETEEFALTFEMEFGGAELPDFRRCEDLLTPMSLENNGRLEALARSVFINVSGVYQRHAFETPVEIEIAYGDRDATEYSVGVTQGYINFPVPLRFDEAYIKEMFTDLCAALAEIVQDLEPELDEEDKDLDGDDLFAQMRLPRV